MALAGCMLAAPAAAGPAVDPLVPAEAGIVAVANFRPMLAAPLVRKYALEELTRALGRDDRVVKVLRLAGLDPLRDVDTFTFAASGDLPSPRLLGIVRGRFDPARMQAAAAEYNRQYPDKIQVLREGGGVVYQVQAAKPLFGAFADRGTFVLSPSKDYLLEVLKKAGTPSGGLNKDMHKALETLGSQDGAWAAGVITDSMKQALRQQDPDLGALAAGLESITGRLELTDALQLTVVIHAANGEAAGLVRKKLDEVLPLLNFLAPGKDVVGRTAKEAVSSIKVGTDKNDVRITMQLTEAMIQRAAKKDVP
jgi:hypothetical protein